jgi:hypothetical protein
LLEAVAAWARENFAQARLGDRRRTKRLIQVTTAIASKPGASLPEIFPLQKDYVGALRLLACPMVTHFNVMAPHMNLVGDKVRQGGHYFFIQDKTELDFTGRKIKHVGPIGDHKGQGFHVQTTLGVQVELSQPDQVFRPRRIVGVAHQSLWTRPSDLPSYRKDRKARRELSTEAPESTHWGEACEQLGPVPEGVQWTYVADCDSDQLPILDKSRLSSGMDFIVRLYRARTLDGLHHDHHLLGEEVAGREAMGGTWVEVRASKTQKARLAQLEVRWVTIHLKHRPQAPFQVVELREVNAPPEVTEPIHWVLGTSWPVTTLDEAVRVARAYELRWLVEEFHKSWKTGLKVEKVQLEDGYEVEPLAGITAIVAVRLLAMKLELGPTGSAEEERQMEQILEAKVGAPKTGVWSEREKLRAIAKLGGFLGRKGDGEPGWLTIWRGMKVLLGLMEGWNLARQSADKAGKRPPRKGFAKPSDTG